jgi:hypothetical protein
MGGVRQAPCGCPGTRGAIAGRVAGALVASATSALQKTPEPAAPEQHRPAQLEVLLIGEPPPDPGPANNGSSTAPILQLDNLYRGATQSLYGDHLDVELADKPAGLRQLQTDGFWLIDAVNRPVNHLPPGPRRAANAATGGALR